MKKSKLILKGEHLEVGGAELSHSHLMCGEKEICPV